MAKKIGQKVIRGDEPEFDVNQNLIDGKIIVELAIYALPGTQFTTIPNSDKYIEIRDSGIFYFDFSTIPELKGLYITQASYNKLKTTGNHFVVIDYIYEEGGNGDE